MKRLHRRVRERASKLFHLFTSLTTLCLQEDKKNKAQAKLSKHANQYIGTSFIFMVKNESKKRELSHKLCCMFVEKGTRNKKTTRVTNTIKCLIIFHTMPAMINFSPCILTRFPRHVAVSKKQNNHSIEAIAIFLSHGL